MQRIAFLWLIYSLTDSATLVAIGIVTRQLAQILLSPWAGLLSDMFNRKKIIIITQSIALFTNLGAGLMIYQQLYILPVIIIAEILLGLTNGLEQPVRQSYISDIINDKNVLGNAISLHTSSINFSQITGPILAGWLITAYGGEAGCYILNSLMLAVFIGGMALIKTNQQDKLTHRNSDFFREIKSGFSYSKNDWDIQHILWITVIASGLGFSFTVLLPAMADQLFGGQADTLGYMHTAIAVGSFVTTLFFARKSGTYGWIQWMFWGSILYGLSILITVISGSLPVALALLFVTGCAKAMTFNSGKTALMIFTHDLFQGRVNGLYFMYMMAAISIGGFFIGLLADYVGYSLAIALFSALNISLCMHLWIKHSGIRRVYVYLKVKKWSPMYAAARKMNHIQKKHHV